jgi:cytochrome d ubiquinol oxidase subunit II
VDAAGAPGHRRPLVQLAESLFLLPVPLLVAAISAWLWRALQQRQPPAAFILTLGLVFLGFSGLGISIWPHIIPPGITCGRPPRRRKARALCWWARC